MKESTKENLIKKFGNHFACRVWYKGSSDWVTYEDCKHVNWKNVLKITVIFSKIKKYSKNGECLKRDGASYLIK